MVSVSISAHLIQSQLDSGYVVQASRSGSFGPLSSLRSIWAYAGDKKIYGAFERPPFPILVDTPTYGDVFKELRMSDFFMGGAFYGSGLLWGYLRRAWLPHPSAAPCRLPRYRAHVHNDGPCDDVLNFLPPPDWLLGQRSALEEARGPPQEVRLHEPLRECHRMAQVQSEHRTMKVLLAI